MTAPSSLPRSNRPLMYVVIGVVIATLLFTWIANQAPQRGTPLDNFDREIAQRLREYTKTERYIGPWMVGLTIVGAILPMTLLAIAGAAVRFFRREYVLGAAWLLIPLTGAILNFLLKTWFDRERPPEDWRDPFVHETNHSFPSGHAMGSVIGFGMLAYMLCLQVKGRWQRVAVAGLLTMVILGVGFSRVYLRAHWFCDVMAGFLIGGAWLAVGIGVTEKLRGREDPAAPVDS